MTRKSLFPLVATLSFLTAVLYSRAPFTKSEGPRQIRRVDQKKIAVLPKIQVVNPNGGETWEKGNRYTIRWTSQGIKGDVLILLKYGPGSGGWYTIAARAPNTGSYAFLLPPGNLDGQYLYEEPQQYTLYVMTLDRTVSDGSDNRFSIVTKSEIKVLYPNGGEKLESLGEYEIRWHAAGSIDRVSISFENADKKTVIGLADGRNVKNSGSYRMKIDKRLPTGNYKIRISAVGSDVRDESDGTFEIVPPAVDCVCGLLYMGRVTRTKSYVLKGSKQQSMRFEVYVQNNGAEILNRVPVMWALLQQPGNLVIEQHEAGFGNVYPGRMYKTTFEFKYKQFGWTWVFTDDERNLKKGRHTFVFEVDPRNELHESAEARTDNKIEVTFEIE